MHVRNQMFWERCSLQYARYFNDIDLKVAEFGSYNINGSVRTCFKNYKKYVGVDWRPQEGYVDVVGLAHEVKLDETFDTVISASLLEHDPYWEKSLKKMVFYMKGDGALFLSWGAALNPPHCIEEAPDHAFHALKASLVLNELTRLGIYIHEFWYEGVLYPDEAKSGMGEVVLVGFRNKRYATGESHVCELIPEDL